MKRNIIFRILIFLIIYSTLGFYISWNGWVWLHTVFGLEDKWIYGFIAGLLFYSYLIGRGLKRLTFLRIIGSYWFAVLQYALLLLPIADLAVWIMTLLELSKEMVIAWTGAVILLLFGIIFLYGTYNAYSPVVRTYTINIPKPGKNRFNLRIAMASDMHFGHLSGIAHIRRLVKGVKELHPDIILLPGDIIDDDPDPFIEKKMGDIMKELSAPLGVYGVLGNHEYYGRAIPEFVKEMERIRVNILQDETIKVSDSFYLVGRKDKTDSKRQSIEVLMADIDKSIPIIMMDHQPAEIKLAEKYGVDLLLSGHTHRGQMAPNHLVTRKIFDLDWGYKQFSQLHAIVSSGFGFWGPPLRIGSRSEIVLIEVSFLD
ncbi:MAG TPA: metallophosphoesterase [Pseudoneobacillus sp.]|nr:metallophosphoesterase [Pseudoneobacillus sp.]